MKRKASAARYRTYGSVSRKAEQEIYFGQYFSIDEVIVKIDAVTWEDVQRVASKLFDESKLSLTIVGPINKIV